MSYFTNVGPFVQKAIAFLFACSISILPSSAHCAVAVGGYTRKDGTYVRPYTRSAPNSTKLDNYGTKGNINPYSGTVGTSNPTPSVPTPTTQPHYVPTSIPAASPAPSSISTTSSASSSPTPPKETAAAKVPVSLSVSLIHPDMTSAEVKQLMGDPVGRVGSPTFEIWLYKTGSLEFKDGKVTRVTVIPGG